MCFSIGEIIVWIHKMAGNLKINNSNFPPKMQEKVTLMDLFNRPSAIPVTPQKTAKKSKPAQKYVLFNAQQWFRRWPFAQDLVLARPFDNSAGASPRHIRHERSLLDCVRWSIIMGDWFPRHPDRCGLGHPFLWRICTCYVI